MNYAEVVSLYTDQILSNRSETKSRGNQMQRNYRLASSNSRLDMDLLTYLTPAIVIIVCRNVERVVLKEFSFRASQ